VSGRRFVPTDTVVRTLASVGLVVLVFGLVVGAVAPGASVTGTDHAADQMDPATVEGDTDLSAFERKLADRFAQRAQSDAVTLSSGDYGQVREQLNGSRYESLLEDYNSVADASTDRERTVVYRRMLSAQASFVDALAGFERAYGRHQRLRDRGVVDDPSVTAGGSRTVGPVAGDPGSAGPVAVERLRESAHLVERREHRVRRVGAVLLDRYRRLGTLSNESYADARRSVHEQMLDVYAQRAALARETFEPTTLSVTGRTATTSSGDPLYVSGRVTANGSAVEDGRVELALGRETATARSGSDGRFEVVLVPRRVPTNVTTATLRYVPDNQSAVAATESVLPVTVQTADATTTATVTPQVVGFGDAFRVSGRVTTGGTNDTEAGGSEVRVPESGLAPAPADTAGIENASVVVRSEGTVLNRTLTESDGSYNLTTPFPQDVSAGEQRVTVVVDPGDRPVNGTRSTTTVTVVERTPSLSVTTRGRRGRTVDVSGNLTVAGQPVAGGSVVVAVGGERVGSTLTGPDGGFRTTVAVPDGEFEGGWAPQTDQVEVAVTYDGGGNIAGTRSTRTVAVTTGEAAFLGAGGAALVLVVGAVLVARRWSQRGETAEPDGTHPDGDAPPGDPVSGGGTGDGESGSPDPSALVAAAGDLLETDPRRAVRVAYAAARRGIEPELSGGDRRRTHWEFYRDCRAADLEAEVLSTLRDATEQYERAAYATDGVSVEAARSTVERVAALVEDRPGLDDATTGD